LNAVPVSAVAATLKSKNPIVILDRAYLDVVFVILHDSDLDSNPPRLRR